MPWNNGVYTRGYPSWSNDAAQNLPISSAKFDTEDNDFATGLNNCLTKDGLNGPSGPMTWSATAAIPLSFTRGSDGAVGSWGRTGGSNNPALQIVLADATGIAINLTTSQQLALAIAGTNIVAITSSAVTISQPLTLTGGTTTIDSSVTINAPAATIGLGVVGATNQWAQKIIGSSTAGQSYGLLINAGTNSSDFAIEINNQGNTLGFFSITGAGAVALGTNGSGSPLSINTSGTVLLTPASSSTTALNLSSGGNQGILQNYATCLALVMNSHGSNYGYIQNDANNHWTLATGTSLTAVSANLALGWDANLEVGIASPSTIGGLSAGLTQVGYMDEPQNAQPNNYGLVITDRGKQLYHSSGTAHTYTIPANSSVAFPIGTIIRIINVGGVLTIAITTDTLTWFPSGTAGNRTLTADGAATIEKITSTGWMISGINLS